MLSIKYKFIILTLWICIISTTCKKHVASPGSSVDSTTLRSTADFPVGAAIDPSLIQNNTSYRKIVANEYSSVTTENVLKWLTVHPALDSFDFEGGDFIVQFCQSKKIRIHGHNLAWYTYNPDWLNHFSGDSIAWEGILKTHIEKVVGHYKEIIASWDVVNEAYNENGTLRDTNCIWAIHLGRDYIARAFFYAHEADSTAKLFYNDYGQEWSPAKTAAIVSMVSDFKKRNIPIDGLGLQFHLNINSSRDGITTALQQLTSTGLLIHIAELDISVNPAKDPTLVFNSDLQLKQADLYNFIVHQYRAIVPKSQQWGITTWNVGDADSWLRYFNIKNDWPLLFNDNYERKPAYFSFLKGLTD